MGREERSRSIVFCLSSWRAGRLIAVLSVGFKRGRRQWWHDSSKCVLPRIREFRNQQCASFGDVKVRITREEGKARIVQYVSHGFQRDDWISTPGLGWAPIRLHHLCKTINCAKLSFSVHNMGFLAIFSLTFPLSWALTSTTGVFLYPGFRFKVSVLWESISQPRFYSGYTNLDSW